MLARHERARLGCFHGGREEVVATDVLVRLAPGCDLLTYFPRRMSRHALRVGIRIPTRSPMDSAVFSGVLASAPEAAANGRAASSCDMSGLRSSVGRCALMPLPDSFFCNSVPVRLSFHRARPQAASLLEVEHHPWIRNSGGAGNRTACPPRLVSTCWRPG